MSDRPPATGPPAWIDPLPDPETSDGDDGTDAESGEDSVEPAPVDLHPSGRLAP